ncbi:hypothetical protein CSB45_05600 [candidate division KSB3 bacterium]|uniref:Tripartite ATP-independent periplasmic transporters DctQ component domain-containing protein n=1 Tax=candidate division KSB3 bacterium TaxID=2044937 RepID=A0A2G6E7H3_9BACT|nr:MAG: hypothetical protein CSB45_05600 [candidate division KSB3 bacterium]PIE30130.1 MAG: hypothetical protein CSA57_04310 [candidate division KSB3 bacterium]
MKTKIMRAVKFVDSVAELGAMLLLVVTIFVTAYQVLMRFVFNNPTSWSEEVTLLCLIWFGYIGVAIGVGRNYHITIESVTIKCPGRIQTWLHKFSDGLICAFGVMMVQKGILLVDVAKVQVLPATQINKSVMYLSLIVSGLLLILYTGTRLCGLYSTFEHIEGNMSLGREKE